MENTGNFCITFEIIDAMNQEAIQELTDEANMMTLEELQKSFVRLMWDKRRLRNALQSVTEQRNHAFKKLGQESNLIDIPRMMKDYE